MIQRIAHYLGFSASRRAAALLLAILLNLAIAPCTMALEVIEVGHDCCPPQLNLETSECCELDDLSVDKRDGKLELWDSPDYDDMAALALRKLDCRTSVYRLSATDPPVPPGDTTARHKLLCVYLI